MDSCIPAIGIGAGSDRCEVTWRGLYQTWYAHTACAGLLPEEEGQCSLVDDVPYLRGRSRSLRHAEAGIQWCAKPEGNVSFAAAGEQTNDRPVDPYKPGHSMQDETGNVAAEAEEGIAILG